jgi:glycosyltransferase involved in cell wall biosynthesis
MPRESARELLVVHYHFRPGGVRRVIELLLPELAKGFEKITLVGGEAPDPDWHRALRKKIPRVRFVINPAFHYFEDRPVSPTRMREAIRDTLRRETGSATIIWAHNLSLGRNMVLSHELALHSARTGIRLVSHHHDFWCDHRWARWPEMRRQGFRTLAAAATAAFSAGARVLHAGINSSDVRLLSRHIKSAAWLPNPAGGEERPAKPAVARAKRWLREELGDDAPVWIYPARFLRRKNFAEAILLARWLAPDAYLVTTGGISSPAEEPYADALKRAARRGRWRVRFGMLARRNAPSVPELLCAAQSVVMTSIQEGFGLPYFEGAGLGCQVIARKLPVIQPDLETFGLRLPGLYDEILIPPGLFNAGAEVRRQETIFRSWKNLLPATCRLLVEIPSFLVHPEHPVPFSRLSLAAQLEVLSTPPHESLAACRPAIGAGMDDAFEWDDAPLLSPTACAGRFFEKAAAFPQPPLSVLEAENTQHGIIRERLGEKFLFPLLMQA